MNLDSLSFTLSQISYLVANLSKRNFEDSCREISGVSIRAPRRARFPLTRPLPFSFFPPPCVAPFESPGASSLLVSPSLPPSRDFPARRSRFLEGREARCSRDIERRCARSRSNMEIACASSHALLKRLRNTFGGILNAIRFEIHVLIS